MNMNYLKTISELSAISLCGRMNTRTSGNDTRKNLDSLDRHQGREGLYINDRGKEPGELARSGMREPGKPI